jgi:hypothetical protein
MIDPRMVAPEEQITRFLLDKSKFVVTKGRVKFNAFTPPKNQRLSVYRTDELAIGAVWEIGDNYVTPPSGKRVLARADLTADLYFVQALRIEPETATHERHANVVNWPPETEWLKVATELANAAELTVRS